MTQQNLRKIIIRKKYLTNIIVKPFALTLTLVWEGAKERTGSLMIPQEILSSANATEMKLHR